MTSEAVADDRSGGLGRRMARGTLAQQGSQVVALLTGLVTVTALGRELSLAEFGVYGLVGSLSMYLYFALGSAETATVTALSKAADYTERGQIFAAAVAVYALLGLAAAVITAAGGWFITPLLVDGPLVHQAQLGAVGVGVAILLGWPAKVFQDLLRAEQRFGSAAVCEGAGSIALALALLALLFVGSAPLWLLIAVGSAIPLFVGAFAIVLAAVTRVPVRFDRRAVSRDGVRDLFGMSGALLVIAMSDIAVNQMDRIVLAAFRSSATVGLYEAAARLNGLIRTVAGTFGVTLLPVLGRLATTGDRSLERDLLVRGTKYVLAIVVPPTIAVMVFADRLLELWLGPEFGTAGTAVVFFLVLWLVAPNATFANSLMVVDRRFRQLAIYSWGVAGVNLALSLVLTPLLGLEGVVLGTTLAYVAFLPFYVRYILRMRSVPLSRLARIAWVPVYGWGVTLAAVLLAARALLPDEGALAVLGPVIGGPLAYWVCFYAFSLNREERDLAARIVGRSTSAEAQS